MCRHPLRRINRHIRTQNTGKHSPSHLQAHPYTHSKQPYITTHPFKRTYNEAGKQPSLLDRFNADVQQYLSLTWALRICFNRPVAVFYERFFFFAPRVVLFTEREYKIRGDPLLYNTRYSMSTCKLQFYRVVLIFNVTTHVTTTFLYNPFSNKKKSTPYPQKKTPHFIS